MTQTARFTSVLVSGLVLTSLQAGCTGGKTANYDPVRDSSTIFETISEPKLSKHNGVHSSLYVALSGDGKHPSRWRASIDVEVTCPKSAPPVLGDRPTLILMPDTEILMKHIETFATSLDATGGDYRNEHASFDIDIEDIPRILDYSDRMRLNDTIIPLGKEEKDRLRSAVVLARETTNSR
jgi:hypothetical protein